MISCCLKKWFDYCVVQFDTLRSDNWEGFMDMLSDTECSVKVYAKDLADSLSFFGCELHEGSDIKCYDDIIKYVDDRIDLLGENECVDNTVLFVNTDVFQRMVNMNERELKMLHQVNITLIVISNGQGYIPRHCREYLHQCINYSKNCISFIGDYNDTN